MQGSGQPDVERHRGARESRGRLGLDTEFMPEGRYRPLLCLVQISAGEQVDVLDPLETASIPRRSPRCSPTRRGGRLHAGRQDVAILRREWSIDVHQRLRHAGRRRIRRLLRAGRLQRAAARRAADPPPKTASFTRWDARPADRRAAALRPRRRRALLPLADEIQRRLEERGRLEWAREECRAIADGDRRARPEGGLAAAAARHRARPARARGGARAGGLARADGRHARTGRSARCCATRRGRARQAPAHGPPRARADPRRQPGRHAAPR